MIVRLTGAVSEVDEEAAVVDRDGLGYEVMFPAYALGQFTSARGRQVTLHTWQFYEGNMQSGSLIPRLIGFHHASELQFFKLFIQVRGIGVRKALRALAQPVTTIATAVESGDAKMLTSLPEIGKRTAQQIITDLQGKLGDFATGTAVVDDGMTVDWTGDQRQALEILCGPLGERRSEAELWLKEAARSNDEAESPEDWVRAAYAARAGAEA
jgi:Holliday junction DNA helicase RuvA